jgi:hypothetical protein
MVSLLAADLRIKVDEPHLPRGEPTQCLVGRDAAVVVARDLVDSVAGLRTDPNHCDRHVRIIANAAAQHSGQETRQAWPVRIVAHVTRTEAKRLRSSQEAVDGAGDGNRTRIVSLGS